MSWKLAEWRWREQAPVRERSLWKIWDVEDAVKNGDVVEEAVRLAYHFPDQVDGRIEIPRDGRLGFIRSGTNPHPPPRIDLPDIPPQHHTSYHPSRSSSAPFLAPFEKNTPQKEDSSSSSSSLSVLLSRGIGITPSHEIAPATPQLPRDFLDIRDWNHLVIDQKVDRTSAVNQLNSSFGLHSKAACRLYSPQRHHNSSQYCSFERANSSAEPPLRQLARPKTRPQKRHKSVDFDAFNHKFQDRVVPWSNLDTIFEDHRHLTNQYFRHEGVLFEVFNPHNSLEEQTFISPEPSSEEPSIFPSHNSASWLIPETDMDGHAIGTPASEKMKKSKISRKETPPAKLFEDLPSAHSEILGHSTARAAKRPIAQDMKNLTGGPKQVPYMINLPEGPPQPGPASPAVKKQLADAKAARELDRAQATPERPLTPLLPDTPNLRLPRTPVRFNREQMPFGEAPQIALPTPQGRLRAPQYQMHDMTSSEGAGYDTTQSLRNVGRYEPHSATADDCEARLLRSCREAGLMVMRDVSADLVNRPGPDVEDEYSHEGDDLGYPLSRCGPQEPKHISPGLSQLSDDSVGIDMSATAPYHNALQSIYRAVDNDGVEVYPPGLGTEAVGESAERDWTSSGLSEEEMLSGVGSGERVKDIDGQRIKEEQPYFGTELGEASWFANHPNKDSGMNQEESAAQESEDDRDWETVQDSRAYSGLPAHGVLQPHVEPRYRATPATDLSVTDFSSPGTFSTGTIQPATPWDPIPSETTRTHPALPGTPHKYRLKREAGTGDSVWVPEYSLPEVGRPSSVDPFSTAQIPPVLPAGALVSKFSTSTPRQQALGSDTSSDQDYPSSPPAFAQGKLEASMAAAAEEQELAQGRAVHELEGDQFRGVAAVPQNIGAGIPQNDSMYSLASEDIIQDEPFEPRAIDGNRPENIPGTRATVSAGSSDDASMRDGMQYGEGAGGIEMTKLGSGRTYSVDSAYIHHGSSEASLPFKARLKSEGPFNSDEDLLKRISTLDDDGSYYPDDEDVASLSSIMREHNPRNQRAGTFNKRTVLGAKDNITGTLRGTGMRATGSSPANVSSDVYDPAMQRHHPYDELSSGPESGRENNSDNITAATAGPARLVRARLTQEQVKQMALENGIDVNGLKWGNVQADITGITTSFGHAIGAPRAFQLPRTLPPENSFELTKTDPLRSGMAEEEIDIRIYMGMDDWDRLQSTCPKFPLRLSHLTMKFTENDPRRTGDNIYNRGDVSRINGRLEEDGFCFGHNRREFSTLPALSRTPLSAELQRLRKKAGREVVWMCLGTPVFGWICLYYIWKGDMPVASALMLWKTNKLIGEMGEEEIEFAGVALAWFGLGAVGVAFGCLAVLLWAFL